MVERIEQEVVFGDWLVDFVADAVQTSHPGGPLFWEVADVVLNKVEADGVMYVGDDIPDDIYDDAVDLVIDYIENG